MPVSKTVFYFDFGWDTQEVRSSTKYGWFVPLNRRTFSQDNDATSPGDNDLKYQFCSPTWHWNCFLRRPSPRAGAQRLAGWESPRCRFIGFLAPHPVFSVPPLYQWAKIRRCHQKKKGSSEPHSLWFNAKITQSKSNFHLLPIQSAFAPSGAPNEFMMTHYLLLLRPPMLPRWEEELI